MQKVISDVVDLISLHDFLCVREISLVHFGEVLSFHVEGEGLMLEHRPVAHLIELVQLALEQNEVFAFR